MGRSKIYTKVEDLEKDIDNYFKQCDKNKKPYTLSGLAFTLDMDRKTIYNYSKDDKFFPTIKKAKARIEQQLEENALMGKGNPTFTIFNLKNNYGWKDIVAEETDESLNQVKELLVTIKEVASGEDRDKQETS